MTKILEYEKDYVKLHARHNPCILGESEIV